MVGRSVWDLVIFAELPAVGFQKSNLETSENSTPHCIHPVHACLRENVLPNYSSFRISNFFGLSAILISEIVTIFVMFGSVSSKKTEML